MRPVPNPAVLLLLLVSVSSAQQETPAPATKAAMEGTVVSAASGEVLNKARVMLRKPEGRSAPYAASSDDSGRFLFPEIEPGRYMLWVTRNGYAQQQYGQRGPGRPGTILNVEPGQHLRDIVVRLVPAAVIAGRVVDEDSEPVPNVQVQAMRYAYRDGKRQLAPAGYASTNDLGEYRVFGLEPGRYYVRATEMSSRWFMAEAVGTGPGPSGSEEDYVPTYYPGTNDPAQAIPLQAGAGQELLGTQIKLLRTRTVRVSGVVFDAVEGQPARRAMVMLVPPQSTSFWFENRAMSRGRDGGFTIRGVLPGEYTLYAMLQEGRRRSRIARLPLSVGSQSVSGIRLVVGPGVDLTGEVHVEGDADLDPSELNVRLQSRDFVPMGGNFTRVSADGTFQLEGVGPDTYELRVTGAGDDFYLKSARLGNEDVLEAGLDLSSGEAPSGTLELSFSPDGGRIAGFVNNSKDEPVIGAQVALVPEARRRQRRDLFKQTTTDQNGVFTLRGIPPGRYQVFAWEDVEAGAWQDPEFLQQYEKKGKRYEIEEGSKVSVELRAIEAETP